MHAPAVNVPARQPVLMRLLARERDVLGLMAEGRSNGAVAGVLVVSEKVR